MTVAQLFQNLHEHLPIDFAENLITSLDTSQLWLLDFDESGAQIKNILESTYTDGITGLEGVENDGKQITGVFLDKISPTITKRYKFTITPDNISYQLENPDDLDGADFTELEFARSKMFGGSKKPKNCPNSTPCGFSCIKKGLKCSKPPNPEQKKAIAELLDKQKSKLIPDTTTKSQKAPRSQSATSRTDSDIPKSPAQMTKDEYVASIPKVVAMSLSSSNLKRGGLSGLKNRIPGLEDKGSLNIGSKNSMVLMPDTQENRDYIKGLGGSVARDQGIADVHNNGRESNHRQKVATALKNGEDVPKSVLADYPDLAARFKPDSTPESITKDFEQSLKQVTDLSKAGDKEVNTQIAGAIDRAEALRRAVASGNQKSIADSLPEAITKLRESTGDSPISKFSKATLKYAKSQYDKLPDDSKREWANNEYTGLKKYGKFDQGLYDNFANKSQIHKQIADDLKKYVD